MFAVFLAQLVPNRGQILAVTTPRCIEFHKHILVVVDDEVGEGGAFQDHYGAGGILRKDGLGFETMVRKHCGLRGCINKEC